MRFSTAAFWLAVILLIAFAGFWRTLGILLAVTVLLLLLFFGALLLGGFLLKRRMQRKMAQFREAFEAAQADARARSQAAQQRQDAIDADFREKED